tara:strand:- start:16 stop:330 length:315 start_codon:yes stop_codon:yes gene_type:complete
MITKAILKINPNAEVSVNGEDINTCEIIWHNGTTPISKADIEAKVVELQADYDTKQYQRDREVQYPSLKEFAEAYTEKEINGNDTKWIEYKTKYNKVRTDNPKS